MKQRIFILSCLGLLLFIIVCMNKKTIEGFAVNQLIENNFVVIYIIDQGKGIDKTSKEKIFGRFYTDRSDKSEFHSGLGLSISKKIIESFNGFIELSNYQPKGYNGACFKLKLPLKIDT